MVLGSCGTIRLRQGYLTDIIRLTNTLQDSVYISTMCIFVAVDVSAKAGSCSKSCLIPRIQAMRALLKGIIFIS